MPSEFGAIKGLLRGVFLLCMAALLSYVYERIPDPVTTTGTVVAREHQSSGGGRGDNYRFIVRYHAGGTDYTFSFSRPVYEMLREFPIGSHIGVVYDRLKPDHVFINRWDYRHRLTLTFLVLLVLAVAVLFWAKYTEAGRKRLGLERQ